MLKIGITGGIGSGKTTLCQIFQDLGIPIFNSDQQARYLMDYDSPLKEKIKAHFGENIYGQNGVLDRNRLSGLVFKDPELLQLLNSLVHPEVFRSFDRWLIPYEEIGIEKIPFVIKESALMFESRSYLQNDLNVLVYAPLPLRIQRIKKREGWDEDKIYARIQNQMSDTDKLRFTDYLVYNDDIHSLILQTKALFNLFKQIHSV